MGLGVRVGYESFLFEEDVYNFETGISETFSGEQRIIPIEGFFTLYAPVREKLRLFSGFGLGYYFFNSGNAGYASYIFAFDTFNGEDFNSVGISPFFGAEYKCNHFLSFRANLAFPYLMTPSKTKTIREVQNFPSGGQETSTTIYSINPPDFGYLELNLGLVFVLF